MIESFGCFFLCQPSSALGMARAPPVLRLSLWLAALYGQLFISGHPEQAEHFRLCLVEKLRELCKHIEAELT